jgi:hypothetical protein
MRTEKELWARIDELGLNNLEWSDADKNEWIALWAEHRERFPLKREEVLEFIRRKRATMTILEIRREYGKFLDEFVITLNDIR